jgi:hypothetical protein
VVEALDEYEEARVLAKDLKARQSALDDMERKVKKAAGDDAALQQQISSRATAQAEQQSKNYADILRDLKLLKLHLGGVEQDLQFAKKNITVALQGQEAAATNQRAVELRRKAAEQGKQIDLVLDALKVVASVGAEGLAGLTELVDVVKDVRSLFGQTRLEELAEETATQAASMQLEHAGAALELARDKVRAAQAKLKEAEAVQAEFGDDHEMLRAQAEKAYDQNAAGFRFDDLVKSLAAADATWQVVEKLAHHARRARNAASYFADEKDWAGRDRFAGNNVTILQKISADAGVIFGQAEVARARVAALKSQWRALRTSAHRAIFTSRNPLKKPAGKK